MAALTHPPPPPPPSTSTRVSREKVESAVKSLLRWRKTKSQTENPQLLEQDEFLYLVLTLKKIPPKGRTNAHKIPLPHSLHAADATDLCLIIDDRPKSNLNKDAAKKKIKAENIPISKVLKLTKLKSDYKPFEAKRKLCDSYDVFFADKRIVPLLPKVLGRHFFKKKRIPVPVDLKHSNWKEQIERACASAMLFLSTGTCCVLRVGRVLMGMEEIVENVMAAIAGVAEVVPRKWGNVRSFHVKLLESLALPVYQAVPDVNLKIEGLKSVEEKGERNEKVGKKKGRIHEVRYMDSNVGDDDMEQDENGEALLKKLAKATVKGGEESVEKKEKKKSNVEMKIRDKKKKKRIAAE